MFVGAFFRDIEVEFYYPIQVSSAMMKLTATVKYFLCDDQQSLTVELTIVSVL